jgi:hypothetical protein
MKDVKKTYFFGNPCELRSRGRTQQTVEAMKSLTPDLLHALLRILAPLRTHLVRFAKK